MKVFQRKAFWAIAIILLLGVFLYPPFIYNPIHGVVVERSWGWIFLPQASHHYNALMEVDLRTLFVESVIAILISLGICLIPSERISIPKISNPKKIFCKGFFRLALVLSLFFGILTPFCHKWIFDEKTVSEISFPSDWSPQEKIQKFKTMASGLEVNTEYLNLSRIEQSNIERQLREILISEAKNPPTEFDKKWAMEKKLRPFYSLSFKAGWIELASLAFIGFASPWIVYLFIRWVVVGFIVGGFRDKTNPVGG